MSTSLINSNMSGEFTSSSMPTSTQLTPQSAKHMLSKIRNLNDVFEFAKNDENNKYLADSISRNFNSKRIKLKELMDEVVVLQTESNRLELTSEPKSTCIELPIQIESQPVNRNKKTLVSILSSPSTNKQMNFNLPTLNHIDLVFNNKQQVSSDKSFKPIGKSTTRDHLNDIFKLIKLNNQSAESLNANSNTNNKLFIEYKPEGDALEDSNEQKKRKSFISNLNEEEQVLSNNINRNMELLQNCLQANLEYKKKSEENMRKHSLRLVKLGSAPLEPTVKKASPLLTSLDDSIRADHPAIKKKLNFYSIGNFNSTNNLKELEEESNSSDDYSSTLDQMNQLIILNEENKESNQTDFSLKSKHTCQVCGLKVKQQSMLKLHMKSHNNLRSYLCSWCNIAFKTKGNLAKHMKTQSHFKRCLEQGINATNRELIANTTNLDVANHDLNSSVSIFNE